MQSDRLCHMITPVIKIKVMNNVHLSKSFLVPLCYSLLATFTPTKPLMCFLSLFLELYINRIIQYVFLCLASFVQHYSWEIGSCCIKQKFVLFYAAVCMPQFSYPFYCWQPHVASSLGLLWLKLLWICL